MPDQKRKEENKKKRQKKKKGASPGLIVNTKTTMLKPKKVACGPKGRGKKTTGVRPNGHDKCGARQPRSQAFSRARAITMSPLRTSACFEQSVGPFRQRVCPVVVVTGHDICTSSGSVFAAKFIRGHGNICLRTSDRVSFLFSGQGNRYGGQPVPAGGAAVEFRFLVAGFKSHGAARMCCENQRPAPPVIRNG